MKKLIIILLLLFAVNATAQIDTASWSLAKDGLGNYSILTNRVTLAGVSAGGIRTPLVFNLSTIDTSVYSLVRDGLGHYSVAINKVSIYGIDSGKIRVPVSYDMGGVQLNTANTWTGTQSFTGMTYFDSILVRVYQTDTGLFKAKEITGLTNRTNNLGTNAVYWKNLYTQNTYIDTIKSDVRLAGTTYAIGNIYTKSLYPDANQNQDIGTSSFGYKNIYSRGVVIDTLTLGTSQLIYKSSIGIAFGSNIYFPNTARAIDWGSGSIRLAGVSNYNFMISNWDGSAPDTTLYINGTDSSVTIYGNLLPSNTFKQYLGTSDNFWKYLYAQNIQTDAIAPRTTSGVFIGNVGYPTTIYGNSKITSLNLKIDSTTLTSDSVYIGRYTLLVNCGATDSNVVWLSDHNVTEGQIYEVMKIDANATDVIVKSKSDYTINGLPRKVWNNQWQLYRFVYRNKTWYIKN